MNKLNSNISNEVLEDFLDPHKVLHKGEKIVEITKAGEGNMNLVLRIKTNRRSFILKQSRSYAEKFPSIKAPIERINTEYLFYKTMINNGFKNNIPNIISYQKNDFFMILEDVGKSDFLNIYTSKNIDIKTIEILFEILNNIHSCKVVFDYPSNHKLKELNHQHMFVLPFNRDNGFDLNSIQYGLKELADDFIDDERLKIKALSIGDRYLRTGKTLLHGDFYPGSWMKYKNQIYVIDPEFSFLGDSEFDFAIFTAHLILINSDTSVLDHIENNFINKEHNKTLYYKYIGIEIIRRLIGIAQLPINHTIEQKKKLLNFSKSLII
tara:strand:+ start:7996 stop:8964 length:969 start_codon:yes stop_codon:yes gene_type:complete